MPEAGLILPVQGSDAVWAVSPLPYPEDCQETPLQVQFVPQGMWSELKSSILIWESGQGWPSVSIPAGPVPGVLNSCWTRLVPEQEVTWTGCRSLCSAVFGMEGTFLFRN